MSLDDITAVICTFNSEASIDRCLKEITRSISSVIVVDGGSSDSTLEIVSRYQVQLLHDSGTGLGEARNLGLSKVQTEYVLNCGADNIMTLETLVSLRNRLKENLGIMGVSCLTKVEEVGLLGIVYNKIQKTRFNSGESLMIGTPNLFRTSELKSFGYNPSRGWSDDEDLCYRMRAAAGAKFEILNLYCLEIGQTSFSRFIYRYFHYGFSDYEIYSSRKRNWKVRRRLKSIAHPLSVEIIKPLARMKISEAFVCLPLLILAMTLRYCGWLYRWASAAKREI